MFILMLMLMFTRMRVNMRPMTRMREEHSERVGFDGGGDEDEDMDDD